MESEKKCAFLQLISRFEKLILSLQNDTEGESQETVHHSQTQKKDDDKSNKSTESKEEAVRKPRNKGPRNPLLAQASAELSQTYTAPAPAPVQGRSERARRTRKQMDIIDPWADFNEEQLAQVQCDEVAAQYLTERDTGGRNGLRPLSTQLTLQERLRVEQNTSANREREITRSRNRSPTPPVITQFPSAANVAQERLDTQLARDIQREEDLSAGLGPESSGDALDKKSQQNMQVSSSRVSREVHFQPFQIHVSDTDSLRQGDGETTGRRKKLNAPKRRAGDRPINQGIDRQGAKVGVVDKSKLKIDFDTERDDPLHPGVVVPGDSVHYDYLESHTEPDWNNAKDIQALNTWRRQIFGRNFPPIKKTREIWVEREKDAVLDLMRKQLDSRRYLKWNRLANDYNKQMAGVVQNSGEKFLSKGIRQFDGLLEDRAAPWRSTSAIMGQAYLWPEYRALMSETLSDIEALGDQGEESDYKSTYSGDDKEIFDPNPGPKSEVTKRKFPKSQTPTASKTMKIVCNTKPARGRKRKRQEAVVEEEGVEIETKVEDESDELVRTSRTTLKIGRWRGRKDEEDQDGDEEPFFPNLYKTY